MAPAPDDHECGWRAQAEAMRAQAEATQAQVEVLKGQLEAMQRQLLGKKSERMPSKLPPPTPPKKPTAAETQEKRRAAREIRDAKVVTEVQAVPVPADQCCCPKCGRTELDDVGSGTTSSVIDYVEGYFRKRSYVRETKSCRCGKYIVTAPAPERVGEGTRYGASFIAHLVVSKCADAGAQYRLEKAFDRLGIPMPRSTMNDQFHRAADELRPLWLRLRKRIAAALHVAADETSIVQQGLDQKAYVWTFVTDTLTFYAYATSRSGETPRLILGGSSGSLLCDAYTGYNHVTRVGSRERAGCNAHARRKIFESRELEEAAVALDLYRQIYEIERTAREKGIAGTAEHLDLRRSQSRPLFARLLAWARAGKKAHAPKTKMGKAVNYLLNHRRALTRFLHDPKLPPDNNAAERALRRVALGRKNFLFVGSKRGGQNLAILYSLVATCEQHRVNPLAYLADVLVRLPDHPQRRIDELLPDRWKPPDAGSLAVRERVVGSHLACARGSRTARASLNFLRPTSPVRGRTVTAQRQAGGVGKAHLIVGLWIEVFGERAATRM